MVWHQRILYRIPYLDNAIFQSSKLKLVYAESGLNRFLASTKSTIHCSCIESPLWYWRTTSLGFLWRFENWQNWYSKRRWRWKVCQNSNLENFNEQKFIDFRWKIKFIPKFFPAYLADYLDSKVLHILSLTDQKTLQSIHSPTFLPNLIIYWVEEKLESKFIRFKYFIFLSNPKNQSRDVMIEEEIVTRVLDALKILIIGVWSKFYRFLQFLRIKSKFQSWWRRRWRQKR